MSWVPYKLGSILVGCAYAKHTQPTTAGYYRVLEVNCSEGDATDKLKDIFKTVFFNMATRVVVEGEIEEETHVAEVVSNLRELPNLHWSN